MREGTAGGGIGERSLALKLLALLAVVLVAVGAVALLVAGHMVRRDARHRQVREATARAGVLAAMLGEEWRATGRFPEERVRWNLDYVEKGRPAWDLAVLRDGAVLFEGPQARPRGTGQPDVLEEVTAPVAGPAGGGAPAPATSVRIRLDVSDEIAEIDAGLWGKGLLALASIVATVVALYFGVDRLVLSPLHRLHRALVRMARGGPYDPVEPRGHDEVAALTAQVNRVVAALMAQQAALSRSEALNRAIADTAQDAMITADGAGTVLSANPAVERILGHVPASSLVGKPLRDLVPERHRATLAAIVARPAPDAAAAPPRPVAIDALHRSGREVPVEVAAGLASTPGGPVHAVVMRDLTRQHAVEAQLLQAQKMEAVGTLAGGIAHDFNNILSVIVGQADLARSRVEAGHRVASALDAIVAAGERAAGLTSRLLGFARRSPVNVRPSDVAEVVQGVRVLLSRTFDRAVEIRAEIPAGLPPILADSAQVEQALINLCINARDAMPLGGVVRILAEARTLEAGHPGLPEDARAGGFVRISVADTGSGMTADVKARLFEPFFTTKERGRGTGLGLPMVYGVVRGHGGFVEVESEPGKGTRFDLWFPQSQKPVERAARAPGSAAPRGTETVLVVDDDDQVRTLIVSMLQSFGYRVVAAEDGTAGVAALVANPDVALVVLDMILPGFGGAEAYRRLRALRDDVRVLLSTGYTAAGDAQEILSKGGDGLLMKPYLPDDLARAVREILDRGPRGSRRPSSGGPAEAPPRPPAAPPAS